MGIAVQTFTLQIKGGPETGRRFWLRPGSALSVGRTEWADVACAFDEAMSSKHFVVEVQGDHCQIRDCDSTNGTFVNGKRITSAALQHGDTILAGRTEFKAEINTISESPAAPSSKPSTSQDDSRQPPADAPQIVPPQIRQTVELNPEGEVKKDEAPASARAEPSLPTASATRVQHDEAAPDESSDAASGENSHVHPAVEVRTHVDLPSEPPVVAQRGHDAMGEVAPYEPDAILPVVNTTRFTTAMMPWENARGEARLSLIIKATFSLEAEPKLSKTRLPVFDADQPYDKKDPSLVRLESDLVPFKPKADVVLVGSAHAPRGRPVSQLDVKLRVGRVTKPIRVFGDRTWSFRTVAQLIPKMSKPEPFTTMELSYARAFGGIDEHAAQYCAENLAGTGFIGGLSAKSIHGKPLPNLEDPHDLIIDWESHPRPVGCGFYGRGWMPRLSHAGTFDEQYLENRSPLPPEDASHAVNNGAHPDLQLDGYLRGDEDVTLENVTPGGGVVRFRLPGVTPVVRVTRMGDHEAGHAETIVRPPLDTLVLLPDDGQFYLVFRAVFTLTSLEEPDIRELRISLGDLKLGRSS